MKLIPERRLKGYQRLDRSRIIIAKDVNMTDSEYRIWDLIGALEIWDLKKQEFGMVEATQDVLAKLLKWDESKVSRVIKGLISKGFAEMVERGLYRVNFLPDYQLNKNPEDAKLHKVDATTKDIDSCLQEKDANLHGIQPQNERSTLSSFKVGSELFGEDDERWIQQHV